MSDDRITITLSRAEYLSMRLGEEKAALLVGAGVDNWEGYDDAMYDWHDTRKAIEAEVAAIPTALEGR